MMSELIYYWNIHASFSFLAVCHYIHTLFLAGYVFWLRATGEEEENTFLQTRNYFGSLECERRGGDSIVSTCEVSISP